MNRKQRRALSKKGLDQAGEQVQSALEVLHKIQGLEGTVKTLEGLEENINQAKDMMQDLEANMGLLGAELALQREVVLRLLSRLYCTESSPKDQVLKDLQGLEDKVREEVLAELEKSG